MTAQKERLSQRTCYFDITDKKDKQISFKITHQRQSKLKRCYTANRKKSNQRQKQPKTLNFLYC